MSARGMAQFLATLLICSVSFPAFGGEWEKTFGDDSDYSAVSLQETSDGGYIVGGIRNSIGPGLTDIIIMKLDSNGNALWQQIYGGPGYDHLKSIQQTSDGGYIVAGNTESYGSGGTDYWVLKLDSNGTTQGNGWQKTYGGPRNDYVESAQQTLDGGYIVAGASYSFGLGENVWVLKLSQAGDVQWQKTYSGVSSQSKSIQQTKDGGYILVGGMYPSQVVQEEDILLMKLKTDGTIEWQKTFGGNNVDLALSVRQTSDDGFVVAGYTRNDAGLNHVWVLKLSPIGDIHWQNTYGGEVAYSIRQTSDEGYIITGSTVEFGVSKLWVLKLTSNGMIQWQKSYGSDHDYADLPDIQQTKDGGYILAHKTRSFGSAYTHAWVLKLDSKGDIPGCGLIKESSAAANPTDAIAQIGTLTASDTRITPQTTTIDNTMIKLTETTACSLRPDLTVSVQGWPTVVCSGQTITLSNNVSNSRTGVRPDYFSNPTTLKFYLSTDYLISPGDNVLGERPVPYLPAEGTDSASTPLTFPKKMGGSYHIIAAVDPDDMVEESNETNNFATNPIMSPSLELISPSTCFEADKAIALRARTIPPGASVSNAEYYLDSSSTPSWPLVPILQVIINPNTFTANTNHSVTITADVNGCPETATHSFRVAASPNLTCPQNIDVRLKSRQIAIPSSDPQIVKNLKATMTGGCSSVTDNRPTQFPPGITSVEFTAGSLICTTQVHVINHLLSFIEGADSNTAVKTYDIDRGARSTVYSGDNIYRFRYDQTGERMLVLMMSSYGTLFDIINVDTGLSIWKGAVRDERVVDGDFDPADRSRVVLISKASISRRAMYRLKVLGKGHLLATYDIPQQPSMKDPVVTWSPDGKKLAVSYGVSRLSNDSFVFLYEWDALALSKGPVQIDPLKFRRPAVVDLEVLYTSPTAPHGTLVASETLLGSTQGILMRQGSSIRVLRNINWNHSDLSQSADSVFGYSEIWPKALFRPFETSNVMTCQVSLPTDVRGTEAAVSSNDLFGAISFGSRIWIYKLDRSAITHIGEISTDHARNLRFR